MIQVAMYFGKGISGSGEMQEVLFPEHGSNMLFRAAAANGKQIVFTGHYQDFLKIRGTRIENDGDHGIFLFKIDRFDAANEEKL